MSKKKKYAWRIEQGLDGGISVALGEKLSDAPFDDTTKLQLLGKRLISIGTKFLGNSWSQEDEDFDE